MTRARYMIAVVTSLAACNSNPINTPIRSFDRPSDVALACSQFDPRPDRQIWEAHPLSDCSLDQQVKIQALDPCNNQAPVLPDLMALVANSARGELALVDTTQARIIDLDRGIPGFNFLPVGLLPEHVRASADGCKAATANSDSCDVALIDLPILYNRPFLPFRTPDAGDPLLYNSSAPYGTPTDGGACGISSGVLPPDGGVFGVDVVERVLPQVKGVPLNARPSWIEMQPQQTSQFATHGYEPGGMAGQCVGGSYSAWVAFPGCELVAEIALFGSVDAKGMPVAAGEVIRAVRVTLTGAQVVTDLSTISCPSECAGTTDGGGPQVVQDAGTATDGGTRLPVTQGRPATIAIDVEFLSGRMFIGDQTGERITIVPIDPATGNLGTPRSVQLEKGAVGVDVVRASKRSLAGKFLYAVARDASVRVIDLDREAECETNPDPRYLQQISDPHASVGARSRGCFPLGDPATPPRAPLATSPGIQLLGGALPRDVAFVHLDTPGADLYNQHIAGPSLMAGDFAWIFTSDGRATAIDIYDACPAPNFPTGEYGTYSPPCDLSNVGFSRTIVYPGHPVPTMADEASHQIRSGQGRFQEPNPGDTAGAPRIQDETEQNSYALAVRGSPVSQTPADGGAGGQNLFPSLSAQLLNDTSSRHISFANPLVVRNETWTLAWEGAIPTSVRSFGSLTTGSTVLIDSGAAFCSHGVQAGDKLELTGCNSDADCGFSQTCLRDPSAPSDVTTGLCLDLGTQEAEDAQAHQCATLMQAVRWYRITRARQQLPLPSGDVVDQLDLAEIYEPEHEAETRSCTTTADCTCPLGSDPFAAGGNCTPVTVTDQSGNILPTACMADFDGQLRCLRPCNDQQKPSVPNPNNPDGGAPNDVGQCGLDFVCAVPHGGAAGQERCMRAPLDLLGVCTKQLQPYQVHVGDAFLVTGGLTGFLSDLVPDPVTHDCEIPQMSLADPRTAGYTQLHQSRIPIAPVSPTGQVLLPVCPPLTRPPDVQGPPLPPSPLNPLPLPINPNTPNVCLYSDDEVARVVRFENPLFTIGLVLPGQHLVPPDQLILSFVVVGGGAPLSFPMGVDVTAQDPRYAVTAPDGQTVFVIDQGKQTSATGLRGQLLRVVSSSQGVDRFFVIR